MKDVSEKTNALRKSKATAYVRVKPETIKRIVSNDLPKKDVLTVARVAGISVAKKVSDLIPYCHPLIIDSADIDFDLQKDRVIVTATVTTVWKTGVEMEALVAASVSALTIYDMLKPVDKDLEITSTKLMMKKGGKTDFAEKVPEKFSAAVIVTSDGTFKGERKDKSGKIIKERLEELGIYPTYAIIPDDKAKVFMKLRELCESGVSLVLTTGGTGLGPRDVTVEATQELGGREIPGIMEAARSYGQHRTPYAMLSRGLAIQKDKTLVVNLPGSSNGVRESLNAIFPGILHAYGMMQGKGH